jgi:CubicO group peptidase (beta-lactamase class C family)
MAAPNLPIPRAQRPSAFIASNAEDMSHYLLAMMNFGRYGDLQILSAAGMVEMQTPAAPMRNGYSYAMGWVVDPDGSLSHTGETSSFTSGIRIRGAWGVFVVRNIAVDQREQRLDEIVPGILNILNG